MSQGNGHKQFLSDWEDRRLDLTTKVAVVTGAASGIGRATAFALAQKGAKKVALVDQMDAIKTFAEQANENLGREAMVPFQGDVTNAEFRHSVFEEMRSKHGPISICVPAAGFTADRLAVKMDRETGETDLYPIDLFERVIAVDLTAPIFWAIETVASVARDRHENEIKRWNPDERVQGCIIFIGSVSSAGNKGQVSYATAKAGLEGAQATLATEAIFHGVRCAIIHPGFTDTAMVRSMGDSYITEHVLPQTQLKRLIRPEEIADAICFMIRNSSVSGELWADAGWHPVA